MKNVLVIGSGIAGLALAEMLTRSGSRVVIAEKASEIGGEGSLATQKWFHTGWLYSLMKNPASTNGCIEAMSLYRDLYQDILGDSIINIDEFNRVGAEESKDSWFDGSRPVNYLYTLNKEVPWYRKGVIERNRILNKAAKKYSDKGIDFDILPQDNYFKDILNNFDHSDNGYKNYLCIKSSDCRLNTSNILHHLHSILKTRDTVFLTKCDVKLSKVTSNGVDSTTATVNGLSYRFDRIFIASGKSIPEYLNSIDCHEEASKIKTIKSPILIFDEKIFEHSFIRFTPKHTETVNHILYNTNIAGYREISTSGSYHYYDINDTPNADYFTKYACNKLGINLDRVTDYYYGIKTEYTGEDDRRYNHTLKKVNNNTYFALAGKFSQFPLLVIDLMKMENILKYVPSMRRDSNDPVSMAPLIPEQLLKSNLETV
jgi:hypothetical protein